MLLAPEVLNMQPYSHSADWWTLGVLMYALLVGEVIKLSVILKLEMSVRYKIPHPPSSKTCRLNDDDGQ